ncbi:MAG: hypothetical protein KA116_13410 [Proteobacteria bacterium]|nr:hypothetical protein [Pseudomonadota bacterium]
MKIDFKECTEEELWKFVAVHLKKHGIDTILVGGAVVSIYSEGAYESGDLDFVLTDMFVKNLPSIMGEIGFFKKGGRHYEHPECKHLFVEFPSSFLEIGEDNQISPDEIIVEGTKIKILSPTDCVRDRLAGYMYFKSRDNFDQAILVAKKHPVNIAKIKKWCANEKHSEVFDEFHMALKK